MADWRTGWLTGRERRALERHAIRRALLGDTFAWDVLRLLSQFDDSQDRIYGRDGNGGLLQLHRDSTVQYIELYGRTRKNIARAWRYRTLTERTPA